MQIREATARDAATIAELEAALERPALPAEWDAWADEPHRTLLAEDEGHLVGAVNVAIVGLTEGWVEGLRVRPEWRRRGVARALEGEAVEVVRHYGGTIARTAIPATDYAALAVAEHRGYERVATYDVLLQRSDAGRPDVPYEAEVHEAAEVGEALRLLHAALAPSEELLPLGWRFRTIKDEMVRALAREGRVLVAGSDVGAAALLTDVPDTVVVHALAGAAPGVRAIASVVAERARERGQARVAAFAPRPGAVGDVLRQRGYVPHPWCPEGLVIVEKRVAAPARQQPSARRGGRDGRRPR